MEDIEFYKTEDGSLGLFNKKVNDVYHSKFGAKTEAIEKFILPSGIYRLAEVKNKITILDVCYGIGYNSKTAVEFALSANKKVKIEIDAIEINKSLVELSPFLNNVPDFVNEIFLNAIQPENVHFSSEITPFLSSIILEKYKNKKFFENRNVRINFYFEDARRSVLKLRNKYDLIFYDAFTPIKQPELWTFELFSKITEHLFKDGLFITYSNSAFVRNILCDLGFYLGKVSGKKKPQGTVASLNENLIKTPLNEKEQGLLKTKAGIYFHDENLNLSPNEILKNREIIFLNSKLENSSHFEKRFNKLN